MKSKNKFILFFLVGVLVIQFSCAENDTGVEVVGVIGGDTGLEGDVPVGIVNGTVLHCGNGVCESAYEEYCSSCPEDCGSCNGRSGGVGGGGVPIAVFVEYRINITNGTVVSKKICGDGKCDGNETCENCPNDCGECPPKIMCGNSKCDGNETCENCPGDCGECPPEIVCGDGKCERSENCSTCKKDCGECPSQSLRKLTINCPGEVYIGDAVVCTVADVNGSPIEDADVSLTFNDGTTKKFKTDQKGMIKFISDKKGQIFASAQKEGYKTSEASIYAGERTIPLWYYIIPLAVLLLLILFLLLRKKKVVSDLGFLRKASSGNRIDKIMDKFKKIYVTPETYKEYTKIAGGSVDKRIETVELNDEGRKYLNKFNDENIALAMQLNAKIVLTDNDALRKIAEDNKLKAFSIDEAVD